jgi:RNA polymerase sigma-70 factor (ECF subfamily)
MMIGLDIERPDTKDDIGDPEQAAVDGGLRRDIAALRPALKRYALVLKRDGAAADDLVQECLCRALAKIHLWQRGTDLRAWLFTILHNQHVSEARRAQRRGVDVAIENAAPLLTIAADAASSMSLRDLERAIDSLPEAQQQAILLVGLEGMNYEDAAATLGIPDGTLRSRLSRAREKLREVMDGDDAAPRPYMRRHIAASAVRLELR